MSAKRGRELDANPRVTSVQIATDVGDPVWLGPETVAAAAADLVSSTLVFLAPFDPGPGLLRTRDILISALDPAFGRVTVGIFRAPRSTVTPAAFEALLSASGTSGPLTADLTSQVIALDREVQCRRDGDLWMVGVLGSTATVKVAVGFAPSPAWTTPATEMPDAAQLGGAGGCVAVGLTISARLLTKVGRRLADSIPTAHVAAAAGSTVFATVPVDFGVAGAAAVRVSVADATVTANTRVVGGVHVPVTRNLDEAESVRIAAWQVTPGVGIEFLVAGGGATGLFDLHYTRTSP